MNTTKITIYLISLILNLIFATINLYQFILGSQFPEIKIFAFSLGYFTSFVLTLCIIVDSTND